MIPHYGINLDYVTSLKKSRKLDLTGKEQVMICPKCGAEMILESTGEKVGTAAGAAAGAAGGWAGMSG